MAFMVENLEGAENRFNRGGRRVGGERGEIVVASVAMCLPRRWVQPLESTFFSEVL